MEFADLNITDAGLAKFEKSLGFSQVHSLARMVANNPKDLARAGPEPSSLESSNLDLLLAGIRLEQVILINPFAAKGFEREPKLFRKIADEGKALEIPFSMFLNSFGAGRAGRFHVARKAIAMARKYKAPVVITSRASAEFECKSPYEILAVAKSFLGMVDVEASGALSVNPTKIAEEFDLEPLG